MSFFFFVRRMLPQHEEIKTRHGEKHARKRKENDIAAEKLLEENCFSLGEQNNSN